MNRPHKPRKITDTNIIRCILMNINEGFSTDADFYSIEENRFQALLDVLIEAKIVNSFSEKVGVSNTSNYCIADMKKYDEWAKADYYGGIRHFVIPLLTMVAEIH